MMPHHARYAADEMEQMSMQNMYNLQTTLGEKFDALSSFGFMLILPLIVVFIVLLVKRKYRFFIVSFISTLLVYILGYSGVYFFTNSAYQVSQVLGIYVPWNVQTLTDDGGSGGFPIDDEWEYVVVRLNPAQMKMVIREIGSNKSWHKVADVSATTDSSLSVSQHAPGYMYHKQAVDHRQYDTWTTNVSAALDTENRILYVRDHDEQGGPFAR